VARGEQNFPVVSAGIARGQLDKEKTEFAGISAAGKVSHRHSVAVIPACAGRLRREGIQARLSNWNDWRSFLCRTIFDGGQVKPVPMDDIWIARVIDNINVNEATLTKA
jgi:hypothetical protein